jgi:hypothetical protein
LESELKRKHESSRAPNPKPNSRRRARSAGDEHSEARMRPALAAMPSKAATWKPYDRGGMMGAMSGYADNGLCGWMQMLM